MLRRPLAFVFWLALLGGALAPAPGARADSNPAERACTPREPGQLAGQLLVAAPSLEDPHFRHAIVFIVDHTAAGALGIVVNEPVGTLPIAKLLEGAGAPGQGIEGEIEVHYGGPVENELGFVLHSADYADDSTTPVNEAYAVTSGTDILRAIAAGTGPRRSLFALGYAGWGAGQLESEVRRGDWFAIPPDDRLIFDADPERAWQEALSRGCYAI